MKRLSARQAHRSVVTLVVFVFVFSLLLIISQSLSESTRVQEIAAEFGYLGVVIIAVIAGLNAVVPIPAATFTPIFVSAGLSIPLIIIALTAGTLIADFTSFFLGRVSRDLIQNKHPALCAFFNTFQAKHQKWLFPLVVAYAAFAPLPNEVILIPLGLTGIKFKRLIIPLILGNLLNQLVLVYGVIGITKVFF